MSRIEVTYRLRCRAGEAKRLARAIAYEQTVELPEELVTDPTVIETVLGRVAAIEPNPAEEGSFFARIHYAEDASNYQVHQLLNLLYGNVSLMPQVRLVDLDLPEGLLDRFGGPRFGIEGLRMLSGVRDRPLIATALKPRGTPLEQLSTMARAFAEGGGDLIKDDQNLFAPDFEAFRRRVEACARAVEDGNAQAGHHCLYFPHVGAPVGELPSYLHCVRELGLRGVLMEPMIVGMDTTGSLAREYGLVLMAHPALAGSYTCNPSGGIDHGILLGTLFRLIGADISIFPNFQGRFHFTRDECHAIRDRLTGPLGRLRPALPCPAGGMTFDDLPEMCRDYGHDAIFLIGGSLLGHSDDLAVSTRLFVERIHELSR